MLTIDLSLGNSQLYKGCTIAEVGGKLNLETLPDEAVNIVGRNAGQLLAQHQGSFDEVALSGAMAIWAYLVVFHQVVHRFAKVWYIDGRLNKILVAAHG